MTKLNQIYKCNVCGNIVEILHAGQGQLVCCNQSMELLQAKTKDIGYEKHVPVLEISGDNIKVKVGAVPHPMEEKHYIEFIELFINGKIQRQFLEPSGAPEAIFTAKGETNLSARIYCNIHGLWQSTP